MKIVMIFLAAIGLWSVAACSSPPEARSIEGNADIPADNFEIQADTLEMQADNAANAAAADMIANAIANRGQTAETVRDDASTSIDNLQQ